MRWQSGKDCLGRDISRFGYDMTLEPKACGLETLSPIADSSVSTVEELAGIFRTEIYPPMGQWARGPLPGVSRLNIDT